MDINEMVGLVRAAVVAPDDTIVITVDRYLTGQQMDEIRKYLVKKLPNVRVVMLDKSCSMQVLKVNDAPVGP